MTHIPGEAVEHPDYLSYLMRLWRVPGDAESPGTKQGTWRVSLESAQTGLTQGFVDLEDLVTYLRRQTGQEQDGADGHSADEHDPPTTVVVVIHRAGRGTRGT